MTDLLRFLSEFKINNEFFYNLFFAGTIIGSFFGCDYWLLIKYPETYKKEIKITDFFISRLRLFVPITVVVLLIGFFSHLLEDENGFIFTFGYIAGCFYFTGFYCYNFVKIHKELLEGSLIFTIFLFPLFGLKLSWGGRITYLILAGLLFVFIMWLYNKYKNKLAK